MQTKEQALEKLNAAKVPNPVAAEGETSQLWN